MKINFRLIIFSLILLLVFSTNLEAQRKNRVTNKADDAFNNEMYFEASELYKKAFKKTKNKMIKAEILFRQGECYRLIGKYKKAANFYKKSIKAEYDNGNPIGLLRLAEMLMILGNYEAALLNFNRYYKKVPTDIIAQKGIKSCEMAIEWLNSPTQYKIRKVNAFSSKWNDFSPAYGNKDYSKIYFVSSREGSSNNKIDQRSGEFFTDIYYSNLSRKGKWSEPIAVNEPVNTDHHEGTLCLNRNGTTMFFTTCQSENKKSLGCEISISMMEGKNWGPLKKLQIKVDSNTTIGHPTISPDETQIIFSAEMDGGYGGKDLWLVYKIARDQWSEPANLGPAINTGGDEMFPFLRSNGTLYFSSDGHIGMGGLDIYKADLGENGQYVKSISLKYPINSSADDFGWIVESNSERGYFTSNRRSWIDNDGINKKTNGSDNIYSFEFIPPSFTLSGNITDIKTGDFLIGSSVKLVGDDSTAIEFIIGENGNYQFELNTLTSYDIVVSKNGYLDKDFSITTVGEKSDKNFIENVELTPIFKDIILPRIFYDFAKWDLRDSSLIDLDKVYEIMNENPEIVIQLNSHTDFRGDELSNKELSQKRADICVSYLISKGISSDRLISNGKGESSPYVITKDDEETLKRYGLFKKRIFKEGQILTESFINDLKKQKHKEISHQLNRRTTFNVISQSYDPDFERLFKNSISNFPQINQIASKNQTADFIWDVENDTDYPMTIYYNGIINGNKSISPRSKVSIILIPGVYRVVAGNFDGSTDATPYSGTYDLEDGNEASTRFIIVTN